MDVELPAKLDLKGKTTVELEKYLKIRVSGEGKATINLPTELATKSISFEGDVTLEIDPEVPAFRPPKKEKLPTGVLVDKIMSELPLTQDEALSAQEMAAKMGISKANAWAILGKLAKAGAIGRIRRGVYRYYKLGVRAKNPNEVRSPGIPIVEE